MPNAPVALIRALLLLLTALVTVDGMKFDCGQTGSLVGASGTLIIEARGFLETGASAQIIDDCTLLLRDFNYTNTAASVSIRMAANFSAAAAATGLGLFQFGAPFSAALASQPPVPRRLDDSLCLQPAGGAEFSSTMPTLVFYDETFDVVLAWSFLVATGVVPPQPSTGACAAVGCPSRVRDPLTGQCPPENDRRCSALAPYFHVWWSVAGSDLAMTVEADVGSVDRYLAFGWLAGQGNWQMVGADAVVISTAGVGQPAQAEDYFIGGRVPCDYTSQANQNAVCPDSFQLCNGGAAGLDSFTLVSAASEGSLMRARFTRPLVTGDQCDHDIMDGPRDAVWAYGARTVRGASLPMEVGVHVRHNGPSSFDFGAPAHFDAGCFVAPRAPGSGAGPPPSRPPCLKRGLVVAREASLPIVVSVVAENALWHPAPPGFGLAFAVGGGGPLAELVLFRNQSYTFQFSGAGGVSANFGFYLTDHAVGGAEAAAAGAPGPQRVFGGDPASAPLANLDAVQPALANVMLGSDVPDTIFYQSALFPMMGWRVYVRDDPNAALADLNVPADSATVVADPQACPDDPAPAGPTGAPSPPAQGPAPTVSSAPAPTTTGALPGPPTNPQPPTASYCPIGAENCPCVVPPDGAAQHLDNASAKSSLAPSCSLLGALLFNLCVCF